jgi:hypothetical protein
MRELEPPFEVEYDGKIIGVSEHQMTTRRVFHIDFRGRKKPLVITVGMNAFDEKFWTSIPEGRQKEAEDVGKLIGVYIRSKNKK